MYCRGPILWFSRTQRCVTLSSTEAEYVALAECLKEVLFVRQILEFLRPDVDYGATTLFEDNEGAVQLAINPLSSTRTKHIDVRYHFIRDKVREGKVDVRHIPSEDQRADILTKPLGVELFRKHRDFFIEH